MNQSMQPCSRGLQAMNSLITQSLQDQQQTQTSQNPHFDPTSSSHDDFLDQMLSSISPSSWTDLKSPWDITSNGRPLSDDTAPENVGFHFDESAILASKLLQHQISGGGSVKMMLQQQQQQKHMLMPANRAGLGLMPLSLGDGNDVVDGFKSPTSQGGDGTVQALFNGFTGSLHGSGQSLNHGQQHFHHPPGGNMQAQNYGVPGAVMNQSPAPNQAPAQPTGQASGSTGGQPGQPRQRVRARRGQATDPHSIAERLRRERIAERMKALQELVPNGNKTDKASMLDEIIDYVKFLQLQVKVLSMSRLGGAAAVAPLVADMSSEGGGGDCIQANANGGTSNSNAESLTVTEHQVAKLMEEDMGSAMQYLQGKGLCLMPISLATAISTATCHTRNPINNPLLQSNGDGPSSPSLSVLTVQSAATIGNGGGGVDGASVSKP